MRSILVLSVLCLSTVNNVSGRIVHLSARTMSMESREATNVINNHPRSHSSTASSSDLDLSSSRSSLSISLSRKHASTPGELNLPPAPVNTFPLLYPALRSPGSAPNPAPGRRDGPARADADPDASGTDTPFNNPLPSLALPIMLPGPEAGTQASAPAKRDNEILPVGPPFPSTLISPFPAPPRRSSRVSQSIEPDRDPSILGGNSLWRRQIRNADYSSSNKASDSSISDEKDSKDDSKSMEHTTKDSSSRDSSKASTGDSPKAKRDMDLGQEEPWRRLPRAAAKRRLRTMQTAPVKSGRYEDH